MKIFLNNFISCCALSHIVLSRNGFKLVFKAENVHFEVVYIYWLFCYIDKRN